MGRMDWISRWKRRKMIQQILREVDGNLQTYYVMRQLDQCRKFKLSVSEQKVPRENPPWPAEVQSYIERLGEYNQAIEEAQAYEGWYQQEIENQNQETARRLHALQERVEEKLSGLEGVMLTARQVFRKELSSRPGEEKI